MSLEVVMRPFPMHTPRRLLLVSPSRRSPSAPLHFPSPNLQPASLLQILRPWEGEYRTLPQSASIAIQEAGLSGRI